MQIYNEIARRGRITEEHRKELRSKRGFTNETIEKCGFFSAGAELKKSIEELCVQHGIETMIQTGLYNAKVSPPAVASTWSQPGIVIPYFVGEDCVYIRRHKYGPKSVPVEMYLPQRSVPSGTVVLAESEFKAAAAWQLGFNAVGIPGIASFSKVHWPKMRDAFKEARAKEVLVCFDSEVKDNPTYANFKQDPQKRYDTEFYAYLMGYLFNRADIPAKIATLPDHWRKNGKIDIDGAVADGKTRADFEAVFGNALLPDTYLDSLNEEAGPIVRTKVSAFFAKTRLEERHNCYWWRTVDKDGNEKHIKVSNFKLDIVATYDDPEAFNRAVVFTDEHGRRSRMVMISPEHVLSAGKFREWAVGKGNYVWEGSDKALQSLWNQLFTTHGPRVIYRPDHVGLIDGGEIWLFGNCGITASGSVLYPDEDNIIYHPETGQGYKAIGPEGDSRRDTRDRRPRLNLKGGPSLEEISDKLVENFGTYAPAVAVGWLIGTIYSDDLFKLYDSFPFLFLFGKRRGGKSTLARYLCAITGQEVEGDSIAESTQTGIGRTASYLSSLPYWLEEYRNEQKIVRMGAYLRAAYNRAGASKGLKADFGTRSVNFRAALLICGEDTPNDAAMLSRCVVLSIDEKARTGKRYEELQATYHSFSGCFLDLVKRRASIMEDLKARISQARDYLRKNGVNDDRTALNWSIPIACYSTVIRTDPAFLSWALEQARIAHVSNEEELTVHQYLNDLSVMFREGRLNRADHAQADIRVDSDKLYIRITDAYSKWCEFASRRGTEIMKASTIAAALKDVPGFAGRAKVRVPQSAPTTWCYVFDLTSSGIPDAIRVLANLDGED